MSSHTDVTPVKKTLPAYLQRVCQADPNKELFVTYTEDMVRASLTAHQLWTLASRFAYVLKERGVTRGDVVVNTLPVSLEAAVVVFGIVLAGGTSVTIDVVTAGGEELFHAIKKAKAKIIITRSDIKDNCWAALEDGIQKTDSFLVKDFAMARAEHVDTAILANRFDVDENGDGFMDFLSKQTNSFVNENVEEDDGCLIFLTSGTTGFPKLALHSHRNIITDAENGESALVIRNPPNYYVATSWSWIVSSPVDILWGLTRVTADFWQPLNNLFKLSAKILKQGNVRNGFLSPLFVQKVAKEWEGEDKVMFDQIFVGGAPVNTELCEHLLTLTHVMTVRYGQTENLHVSYNNVVSSKSFYSYDCGCAYPGTQIRIVDDNMQDVALGDPGRILVKTAATFRGYLNDPEKTAQSKLDGWYNCSDAGYLRPSNRNIVVIGRYDYIIQHKSTHFYPAWIEKPIREHPSVAEVIVVPVPDEVNHHNICACVILKPGNQMTTKEVQDIFKNRETPDSDPKHIVAPQNVLFYEAFPTNARGKVVMNKLIEDASMKAKKQTLIAKQVHMG